MSDVLKLKYKVGGIEFEAEGPADAVEQQRLNFMNTVLPAAVDAMIQTHAVTETRTLIEESPQATLLEAGDAKDVQTPSGKSETDYSRISLASFLKKYGTLTDLDFTLFAAYFDEKKNGTKAFSSENIKQYYQEGRRSAYSNNSMLLRLLAQKGYIMDTQAPEGAKSGKYYMLSEDGLAYVENYVPKEEKGEKKKARTRLTRASKSASPYSAINADDLNLSSYPAIKSFSSAKAQVILAMYIVTNEGKGEWFTVDDVIHLLVNIFEVPANVDKVNGVFKKNKAMFHSEQDPSNKKALRRKLLSGAKDYAVSIIQKDSAD